MTLSHVARAWQAAGVSIIPILANQTKRPAIRWAEYQVQIPTQHQVDEWWGNGKPYGLAVICGAVSGNLEMTEIEGRACYGDEMTRIMTLVDDMGIMDLWELLTGPDGYSETSPSGGIHLLYRINDPESHPVPGNTKIAQSKDNLVLAETRGEGGYVIVAPTPGICHPSGESWDLLQGEYGRLPVITWQERCLLHEALRLALDDPDLSNQASSFLSDDPRLPRSPHPSDSPLQAHPHHSTSLIPSARSVDVSGLLIASHTDATTDSSTRPHTTRTTSQVPAALPATFPVESGSSAAGSSPGDHFELVTDWSEILEPHGWRLHSRQGPERLWTRPGKEVRDGHSATTGFSPDRDRLYVFSTSTIFPSEQSLTKFAAHAILNFGGNFQMAAADLMRRGFGFTSTPELDTLPPGVRSRSEPVYELSDDGNAERLADRIRGRYHYLNEEKCFIAWDGKSWQQDKTGSIQYEFKLMVREELEKARGRGDQTAERFWKMCSNTPRRSGCLASLMSEPGFQITVNELDKDRHLVNVGNGIYDLTTHELRPHDPKLLMTKTLGASYEPEATCPKFDGFLDRVLPDPGMRSYVQRALGYSMLGDGDRRSLFLICGPSGTGKSTLMNTMELLFGGYGATAPSGTLRAAGKDSSSPSNDLHTLMGKRFVSTSETNEHTAYNEDLIKRLTGRDTIKSRKLYSEFQEWSPRCTIWLATNHPPRFSSDDDALWRRAKIVPFETVLLDEGEIPDYAHNVLIHELDGIFNWLLAGLKAYQAHGLGEPDSVHEAVSEVRLQSDPVSRFLEDLLSDGLLVRGEDVKIRSTELYSLYTDWTRRMGERSLGSRRFTHRVSSSYTDLENVKIQGNYFWRGIGRTTQVTANWLVHGYNP